ncbi:MAG: cytochrome oxidase assembly protein [Gammaproteobacteria bacterium]
MSAEHAKRGRSWQAWLLAAMFFGPLAVAWFLYFDSGWRPGSTTNHGQLVSPAVPLPAVSLPTPAGGRTDAGLLRDTWSLVYVDQGRCGPPCRDALHDSRQTRLALGRRMDRLQRVYLYTGQAPDPAFIADEHPDLVVAALSGPDAEALAAALPNSSEGFWLVDPLGNLMMGYAPDAEPKGMLEDLKKLLRISRIG